MSQAIFDDNCMEDYDVKILLTHFKKNLICGGVEKVIEFQIINKKEIDQINMSDSGYSEQILKRTKDPKKLKKIHRLKNPLLQIDALISPPRFDAERL